MRTHLTTLLQSLEEDVAQHYNELAKTRQEQLKIQSIVNTSVVLSTEQRMRKVSSVVHQWMVLPIVRRVIAFVVCLRIWIFVRHRRLPQLIAHGLIKWLSKASNSIRQLTT